MGLLSGSSQLTTGRLPAEEALLHRIPYRRLRRASTHARPSGVVRGPGEEEELLRVLATQQAAEGVELRDPHDLLHARTLSFGMNAERRKIRRRGGDLAGLTVAAGLQLGERPVDHPWPFCVSKHPLQIWHDRRRFLREAVDDGLSADAGS